jgi:hypothetical protein
MGTLRAGGEKRGNSRDRRNRKVWMLRTWDNDLGVEACRCVHCARIGRETILDIKGVEADRIVPGASYAHDNVQPSCRSCNLARSNNIAWAPQGAFA